MAVRFIDDLGRVIRDDILLDNTRQVPNVPRGANDILTRGRINNWAMDVLRGKPLQAQAVQQGVAANPSSFFNSPEEYRALMDKLARANNAVQGDPLDVIYPRGNKMNFRNYYNKVGTSGFPGGTIRDLLPNNLGELGQMYKQNWTPAINKTKQALGQLAGKAKGAGNVTGKVLTYGQLAMLPVEMIQNEAMARQMEKENQIQMKNGNLTSPHLHTQEAINNRRARNANLARWAGYGAAIGSPFGPDAAARAAGLMSGAALLGEGIADKFSKRKSVVDTVGTYKPLGLSDEQLARVLMTQEQRDANPIVIPQEDQQANQKQPQGQSAEAPDVPESEYSNPQDFPYQVPYRPSWMAEGNANPGIQQAPVNYGQASELPEYTDVPQDGANPILTGEVNNGAPGLDLNNLKQYMTPGEIAYQNYLAQSPLSDPQKIADLLLQADRDRYRQEVMNNLFSNGRLEMVGGAPVIRHKTQPVRSRMSQAEAMIKAQQTAGNIIKLQSDLEDKALQRQGAEQVARQLNLPPALLTNPDLAKQALQNYGRLQTTGLQEGNRYDIALMNNKTKTDIARDLDIFKYNQLYSNAQLTQAKLNMQERIARMTGDARLATALVNLATNSMDTQEQVRAQMMISEILRNAGYDTNYTTSSERENDYGYGNLDANDTWNAI